MPIFGRSSQEPDPGDVHRVSANPDLSGLAGPVVVPPAPPAPEVQQEANGATPVPTRLQRLAAVVDRARPGRSSRNVRKWLEWIGMALIVFGFVARSRLAASRGRGRVPFFLRHFQELLLIFRQTLRLPEFDNCGNFFLRDEWSVQTMHARRSRWQIEHVAFAQERFSAIGIENRARVDLGRNAERNAGREVGFN